MDKFISFFGITLCTLAILIFVADFEEFKIKYKNNCNEKKYVINVENNNIYYNCIEEIKVEHNKELYDFEEFVKDKGLKELFKKENNRSLDRKTKSIVHYYNNFVIIECKNATNDIVIGKRGIKVNDAC